MNAYLPTNYGHLLATPISVNPVPRVRVGATLRNNDPRYPTEAKVIAVVARHGFQYAMYQSGTRKCSIRFDRIYDDGKPRHHGWSVVSVLT